MSRVKIFDLSFCEQISSREVQGGLSPTPEIGQSILDWFKANSDIKLESLQKDPNRLLEYYRDKTGQNAAFRSSSLDGKQQLFGASGVIPNGRYSVSASQISK